MLNVDIDKLSDQEKIRYKALLDELVKRRRENQFYEYFTDSGVTSRENYIKHVAFMQAGTRYKERAIIGANRVGKTKTAAYEMTCHLTGLYPTWWMGKRFDKPITAWIVSDLLDKIKESTQAALIGYPEEGTGMVPKSSIIKTIKRPNTGGSIQDAYIQHVSGGQSLARFKATQQGVKAFKSAECDIIWFDEEPNDQDVYNESLMRLLTTKGCLIATFTPQSGYAGILMSFLEDGRFPIGDCGPSNGKFVANIWWDDVPHLDEKEKESFLASCQDAAERDMRSKGLPKRGTGAVYSSHVAVSDIECKPFKIPDHWPRTYGMDVGWHKTAVIWGALDPNTDILYLYDEHYAGEQLPVVHAEAVKARGDWIRGVMDHAAKQHHGRPESLWEEYRRYGLHVHEPDKDILTGVLQVRERLETGRMKVFTTCQNWFKEYFAYHYDKNGNIAPKQADHLMDSTRYLVKSALPRAKSLIDHVREQNNTNRPYKAPYVW